MKVYKTKNPSVDECLRVANHYDINVPVQYFYSCKSIITNINEDLGQRWVTYAGETRGKTDNCKWSFTFEVNYE